MRSPFRVLPPLVLLCLWWSAASSSSAHFEPGSQPGWEPPAGAERDASDKMRSVLQEMDAGLYEQAYWNLDADLKASLSEDQFAGLYGHQREMLGPMTELNIVRVTWSKPVSGKGLTGIYATIDITRTFERERRDCGYVVLHQNADDANWWVLRLDDHGMPDDVFDDMVRKGKAKEANALWAQLKRGCPNVP